jgi:hypothetical protein
VWRKELLRIKDCDLQRVAGYGSGSQLGRGEIVDDDDFFELVIISIVFKIEAIILKLEYSWPLAEMKMRCDYNTKQ